MVKYFFLAFYILIISIVSARAQSPWYFGTGEAVNLTNGTAYKNGVKTIAGSLNPSSTAVSAPAGSMYYSTSGTIYVKQDAGLSTNWLPLGIATTGSLTTINGQSGPNVSIASGTSGSDFAVSAASNTITLNLPTASAIARGALSSSDWSLFNSKEPAVTATTSADYYRGDKTFQPLNKAAVGLSNVDNTSDAAKPISTATQAALNLKEDSIAAGTTSQYWRGDKSWQTLDKSAVGLGNVDNTSDANKPVSTATQTALNLKQDAATAATDAELAAGLATKEPTITTLPLSKGGTNNGITAVNGGVAYSDASKIALSAAGTSGQILQSNGAAAPTFVNKSISGKAEGSSSVTVEELQVPNYQLTPTATNKYLINNCGSPNNILANCGFENINPGTSYTLSPAVPLLETSDVPEGKQSLSFSPTAQPFQVTQDSTLHATAFADGVQGLAMARVKVPTTVTENIVMCPTLAGVLTTTCVSVPKTGKWVLVKVPFILGATSNGLSIHNEGFTNMTATGIKVDDLFVGAVDLKQDINIIGPWTTGTCTATWTTNTTVVCKYRQVGENLEIDANLTLAGAPNAATLTFNIPTQFTIDSNKISTNLVSTFGMGQGINAGSGYNLQVGNITTTSFTALYQSSTTGSQSVVTQAAPVTWASGNTIHMRASFPVTQFSGASSVYTAQNSDTDWATCNFPTLAWQGLGTVTNTDVKCKRQGSDLIMKGYFTGGTATGSVAQIPLPLWNGSQLAIKSGMGNSIAGRMARDNAASGAAKDFVLQAVAGTTYLTIGLIDLSLAVSPFTSQVGTSASGNFSFENIRIPINGWENSNVIIGSFNEVMTTPGISKPKTCYYGFGGASATLAAPTECTTGTCTEVYDSCGTGTPPAFAATALYTALTFASGTFANSSMVDCKCTAWDTTTTTSRKCEPYFATGQNSWGANSSGGLVLSMVASDIAGAQNTAYVQVKCEGQAP